MTRPNPARIAGLAQFAVLAGLLFTGPAAMAEEPAPEDPGNPLIDDGLAEPALQELETILVYGGQAVPQMWKVSNGEHVLWVVANRSAPAGSTWRMDELEARLAESQLLMLPGRMKLDLGVNIVHALTLLPTAFKAAKKHRVKSRTQPRVERKVEVDHVRDKAGKTRSRAARDRVAEGRAGRAGKERLDVRGIAGVQVAQQPEPHRQAPGAGLRRGGAGRAA